MKNYLIIFAVLVIFLVAIFLIPKKHNLADVTAVKIAGQTVKVDLALTPQEQEQGLSGRKSLDENTGMLFIFDTPDIYDFWMKDMLFPIDMVWLAGKDTSNMHVVYIKKNANPKLYPETYGPNTPAQYVLEVPAGFSYKNNLQIGDEAVAIYK